MGALSPAHLIIILVIALLILGPGKLPETGAALGRAFRDFRNAVDGNDDVAPTAPTANQSVAPAAIPAPAARTEDSATDPDKSATG